jgi:hypothetical protein
VYLLLLKATTIFCLLYCQIGAKFFCKINVRFIFKLGHLGIRQGEAEREELKRKKERKKKEKRK